MPRALVVFHAVGTHPLSHFLHPGFRHVFVCLRSRSGHWLRVDGEEGCPTVEIVANPGFDLASFYRDAGCTVVETETRNVPVRGPFVLSNCVGLVKAVLHLRAPLTLTPYGLYRLLVRERAGARG